MANVWNALPTSSMLIQNASAFAASALPATYGCVEIVKSIASTNGFICFHEKGDGGDYRMGLTSSNEPTGTWVKIIDRGSIIQEAKTITGITVTANGAQSGSVSVAKSGYTPLGVIGVNTSNGYGIPSACYISGTTLNYRITNSHQTSNVNNAQLTVNILYLKN